jgi:hypothetical protein
MRWYHIEETVMKRIVVHWKKEEILAVNASSAKCG